MLTLTCPVETALHRWPAGVKLGGLVLATAGLFALPGGALGLALAAVLGLHLALGRAVLMHGLRMVRPLWPFGLVLAVWHLATGTPGQGAAIAARLAAAVMLANLVTMTTRLTDLLAVVERLAAPLARLGLPPRVPALAFALVIRFVPVFLGRAGQLAEAWRARSPRRPGWPVVLPLVLIALDDAEHVAEALRARGGV